MDDKQPTPAPRLRRIHRFISCPVFSTPVFDVLAEGIEVKCRSCRAGEVHFYSWSYLEEKRQEVLTQRSSGAYIQRD